MIKSIKMPKPHSSESGYTIMEGLVAMIVVATLMSAIAPVIAISVGTRVQARRIELAAQAARSYIDGVRAGSIPPPEIAAVQPSSIADDIDGPATLVCPNPPDQNAYCTTTVSAGGVNSQLYCVDGGDGGDCTGLTDMVVYAVGFHGVSIDAADG
ncbi:MAG: type II secretion system protein, partial [Okeania sp. SIO2D1]|nr:type II secretion system protein [Okeania sp. SIO2D1]